MITIKREILNTETFKFLLHKFKKVESHNVQTVKDNGVTSFITQAVLQNVFGHLIDKRALTTINTEIGAKINDTSSSYIYYDDNIISWLLYPRYVGGS